jgi:4-hydroxy-4-methyl-2-oxoglutarate aldolase
MFHEIPTTTLADVLGKQQVMDFGIRRLWSSDRVAGPAFTVRCPHGDNLMLHAAIYRAEPGAVIVVESGDTDFALAGGNVCAIAHRRGIEAFVLDGVVRDIGEIREDGFPVHARGVVPIPGVKKAVLPLNEPITCGGVTVHTGDIVVADEDGVVVVPKDDAHAVLDRARQLLAREAEETLDQWEARHRAQVDALVD